MKNVLIISYYFPPAGGPGVQRVAKHVKYLRESGYNPIVITAAPSDYAGCSELAAPPDESLLQDIPAGTEIHRVRSRQPFRLFALLRRLRLEILREFLFVPDSALTWILPVIMEARRIAAGQPVDLIYTSVKPHSVALAGRILKRLLGKPWVLDFRDPWTRYFLATFPTRLHYQVERILERSVLRHADHVITATRGAREQLLMVCRSLSKDKVTAIPNGYDAEDYSGPPCGGNAAGIFTLVYAGVFCGGPGAGAGPDPGPIASCWRRVRRRLSYQPRGFDRLAHSPKFLLDALKELFAEQPERAGKIRLVHAGPDSKAHQAYAKELGLPPIIEAKGYVAHSEAVRLMEQGDALFLSLADSPAGEPNDCVPQKVYEYMGARKPVLALVPEGDAADILRRAGTGVLCPPRDVPAIKQAVIALLEHTVPVRPDEAFIRGFERRRLTGRLAAVFDRLTPAPAAAGQASDPKAQPDHQADSGAERPRRTSVEISVIIPTRNRSETLLPCLQALAAQEFPATGFEVLVCDDGSEENLSPVIDQARALGLDIHCFRQPPRGPAAARNLGIRHARGQWIAMTDSDAVPDRMWLRRLSEALMSDMQAVGVEGRVCAGNQGQFGPLGEGPTNLAGGVFLTCNCAYRRDALLRIGGFDETFPYPAYEDTELAARALGLGRILWQPQAVVTHPERRLTLAGVFKKLRHWDYVVIMGYRYGYLAWKKYPVRHPRLRVALLSLVGLPYSKLRTAACWLRRDPRRALTLAAFGIMESLGALILVLPRVLTADYQRRIVRNRYLESAPW